MSALLTLVTGAAGAALVLAIAGFMGRSFVQGWLARDVAKYQADLAKTSALEVESFKANLAEKLETFKSDLQREADRARLRFETVHERLHEILPALYATLWELDSALSAAVAMGFTDRSTPEERLARVDRAIPGLAAAVNKALFYLPKDVQRSTMDYLFLAMSCRDLWVSVPAAGPFDAPGIQSERPAAIAEAVRLRVDQVGPAFLRLQSDYRRILGVEST